MFSGIKARLTKTATGATEQITRTEKGSKSGLDVNNLNSEVSAANTTETPLTNGSVFTGEWAQRITPEMIMAPFADQDFTWSAQFANSLEDAEAGNIDSTLTYNYTAGAINVPRRLVIAREWFRVVITNNSGSDMTEFRFQTSIGDFAPLASRLNAGLATDADAELVRAIISGRNNVNGLYENVQLSLDNHLLVDIANIRSTSFSELKTATRFAQIELKSAVDAVSNVRNVVETTNGSVTVDTSGEYKVSTTGVINAESLLQSGERGRYIPGYEAEVGIGVRLPDQTWTGTAHAEWGYFDDDNGFGFGRDATGLYVFTLRSGTKTKVYQSNWNKDTLDGSGDENNPSGLTCDPSEGLIYQVELTWYGYGVLEFAINIKNGNFVRGSRPIDVHEFLPDGETSIAQPNLPISVKIENGDQAAAKDIYVGGRQFSIYGEPNAKFRVTGERRTSITISAGAWTPVISFRRKTGIGNNQSVQVSSSELIPGENVFFAFITGGTLTGASFGAVTDINASETTLESDVSATAITGGDFIGGISVALESAKNSPSLGNIQNLNFDFTGNDPVTLVVRTVDGTAGTLAAATFNCKEQW